MWRISNWTAASRAALIYITIGAFTVIWAGVWYVYLINNPPAESAFYWCTGLLVTGLTMLLIGSVVGLISHSVRHLELPPAGVPVAMVNVQPNVAAPVPAPVNLIVPAVPSNNPIDLAPRGSLGG